MLKKRIRSFAKLTFKLKLLFFEAVVLQYLVWLVLFIFPFRWIKNRLTQSSIDQDFYNIQTLIQVKEATKQAQLFTFWKNKCLVKSLAARIMLQRRGIASQLVLGVKKDHKNNLIAHAWLNAGNIELVKKDGEYLELYRF